MGREGGLQRKWNRTSDQCKGTTKLNGTNTTIGTRSRQPDCFGQKDPMPASPAKVSTLNRRQLDAGHGEIARAAQVQRSLDLQ
eukprot:1058723-Rhodomonas_salina.2